MQNWINQVKQNTSPSVVPDMSIVEIEGKKIVVIDVKEYPIKPISYKNSSWDHYTDTTHSFNDIS